jgi:tripartite-type tricarboxylate transporter receptor subunit TctC
MTLLARPDLGIANAEQLVVRAKQKPNGLSVGTTGSASLQAFAAVAIQRAAGIDLLGVPFKGGAPLLNDLLAGQLDLGLVTLPAALPHVRAGKLTMLGVLSDSRASMAPDLPTLGETPVFKGVTVEIWAAIAGPKGLPPAVTERLSKAVKTVLEDRAFVERRSKLGDMAVPFQTPADFGAFLAAEDARYRALATGLKLE